jgi:hypothetical protein
MSLHLEFEPHSWYMGFAIKNNRNLGHDQYKLERELRNNEGFKWSAYTADGNSYSITEYHADTLDLLKGYIREYRKMEAKKFERLYGQKS